MLFAKKRFIGRIFCHGQRPKGEGEQNELAVSCLTSLHKN
jgi:hypothetical protein